MTNLKKKILIVDDEQSILRILVIKLGVSGYEVSTALNGKQALDMVQSFNPDIMLLDVLMPEMDGFQVIEQLRSSSSLPIIAFSARPEYAGKALSLGANDFIVKPFDVDDLTEKIQCVLERTV
jgi:two-component system KDP operon response regulator KdpE